MVIPARAGAAGQVMLVPSQNPMLVMLPSAMFRVRAGQQCLIEPVAAGQPLIITLPEVADVLDVGERPLVRDRLQLPRAPRPAAPAGGP